MLSNRVKKFDVKSFLLLLLFNILALLPLICFAFQHFSIDSYGMIDNYDSHCLWWIGCFRYFGSLVSKIWFMVGNDPVINPVLDVICYIVIVGISSASLSFFIYKKLDHKSISSLLIVNTSALITLINPWFSDMLTFPECIFATTIGVMFCISSLIIFSSIKNKAIKYLISGFMLICSTAVLQQFFVVFIIYLFLLTSIETINNNQTTKQLCIKYLSLIIYLISCATLYFVIGIGLQKLFDISPNSRVALNLESIINNLKYFAFNQHSYLKGRGFFNTEILTVCYLVVIAIWIISFVYYIKKHKFNAKAVFLLISYIAAYASSFGMGLISTSRSHRTMFGLFSVFALFSIGSILLMNNKITKRILCVVLLVVYGLSVFKTVEMSINQYKGNTTEKVYANLYLSEINAYEKSTGNTVKNIEICTDKHCDTTKGESALTVRYAFEPLMKYISNRDFIVKDLTDNQIKKEFENKDWNEYNPNEQMIFNGDTLYLCVY